MKYLKDIKTTMAIDELIKQVKQLKKDEEKILVLLRKLREIHQ